MESPRFSHFLSFTLVYIFMNCAVFSERLTILKYKCAERGACECSEGIYDPFYTGIITIDCRGRNLTKVPVLIGIPNFKYYRFLLRDNRITFINNRDFRYSLFIEIDLGGSNSLIRVADKAFVATSRFLRQLTLNVNQINVYKLRFLHGVPKIQELTLESNGKRRQTTLPSRVFPGYKLKAMRKLTLTGFGLTKIAWDAFLGVSNIHVLRLQYNNLSVVPTAALKGLRKLSELDLSYNNFRTLAKYPFEQLYKLSKLDLSHNLFDGPEAFAPDAFSDLKNCLKILIISNSSLSEIPSSSLRNLKALSHLNLSDNRIQDFNNSGPFRGHYKLRELDISGNNLDLSKNLFSGLNNSLHRLIIRRMKLKSLPKDLLTNFTQLHYLDMSGNMLTRLPADFNRGLHIRHFILRDMYINEISGGAFVKPAPAAKLLVDLSSNRMTSVSFVSDTRPCTFLEVVLSDNPIQCDCALYRVVTDDTIHLRGQCNGGGKHFRHVSITDHALTDTLRRVCTIPEANVAPCRRLDAQWRAHKQFSGVVSVWEKLTLTTLLICWAWMFIFAEVSFRLL